MDRGRADMATIRVFISYRRDTDAARATLVAKSIEGGSREGGFLDAQPGIDVHTYMDVQQRLGIAWPDKIREELAAAHIVIVVIGPEWLSAVDKWYKRRIDQEDDWVRREVELGLSKTGLVPVLFDGAGMPPEHALPQSISALGTRLGIEVRTSNFDSDIQPLLREILEQGRSLRDQHYARPADDYRTTPWPYPDPPLVVKPAPLSDEDVEIALMEMIPGWKVESTLQNGEASQVELSRQLTFQSFLDVLAFMSEVGRFCDAANHHPRWENIYQTLLIRLSTWDIG